MWCNCKADRLSTIKLSKNGMHGILNLTSKFYHLWSVVWNSLQLALCDSSYTEHFQTVTENTFLGVVTKLHLMPLWNLHNFDVVS